MFFYFKTMLSNYCLLGPVVISASLFIHKMLSYKHEQAMVTANEQAIVTANEKAPATAETAKESVCVVTPTKKKQKKWCKCLSQETAGSPGARIGVSVATISLCCLCNQIDEKELFLSCPVCFQGFCKSCKRKGVFHFFVHYASRKFAKTVPQNVWIVARVTAATVSLLTFAIKNKTGIPILSTPLYSSPLRRWVRSMQRLSRPRVIAVALLTVYTYGGGEGDGVPGLFWLGACRGLSL
jgi:hypothetical protein